MEFCEAGTHPTLEAFRYGDKVYCPKHLPPLPDRDERDPGYCEQGRGHWADDTIYLQSRQKRWCRDHFDYNVREYLRRGQWRR